MLKKYNQKEVQIFHMKIGIGQKKLSKNYTWWAKESFVKKNGLRFFDMNYALRKLYDEGSFYK